MNFNIGERGRSACYGLIAVFNAIKLTHTGCYKNNALRVCFSLTPKQVGTFLQTTNS